MKKIPTLFERDWEGNRALVTREVNPKCQWVIDGEGWPTRKVDGTCCLILNGVLFKRREMKPGDVIAPIGFMIADVDDNTGVVVGWVPVGADREDLWHRQAMEDLLEGGKPKDGTYELLGPKIQKNPESQPRHVLIHHYHYSLLIEDRVPRDFDGLRDYLAEKDIEGIVWHHKDGRMAKIKKRDFGFKR